MKVYGSGSKLFSEFVNTQPLPVFSEMVREWTVLGMELGDSVNLFAIGCCQEIYWCKEWLWWSKR